VKFNLAEEYVFFFFHTIFIMKNFSRCNLFSYCFGNSVIKTITSHTI